MPKITLAQFDSVGQKEKKEKRKDQVLLIAILTLKVLSVADKASPFFKQ